MKNAARAETETEIARWTLGAALGVATRGLFWNCQCGCLLLPRVRNFRKIEKTKVRAWGRGVLRKFLSEGTGLFSAEHSRGCEGPLGFACSQHGSLAFLCWLSDDEGSAQNQGCGKAGGAAELCVSAL